MTRLQRVGRRLRRWKERALLDALGAATVISIVAAAGIFLPLRATVPSTDPAGFIATLWQVQAATVGLTITIVLFVFQVFSSRSRGSVHQFAEETGLFPIFFIGLWAIALDGVALLGYGYGGAAGWAGVWATAWNALSLLLVAVLFVRALRTIDVQALEARRIRDARRELDAVVDRVILERFALVLLRSNSDALRVDVRAFLSASGDRTSVRADRGGRVHDLNIRALRKAGALSHELLLPTPVLGVHLGSRVGPTTAWLSCAPLVPRLIPRLQSAIEIANDDLNARLRETLDELHEEALQAIRAPAPARYAQVVDAYIELVLALPEAWSRFGLELAEDVGVASDMFEWTFLDSIRSNAYEELLHALDGRDRDIVQEIVNFPIQVAMRALDVGALALSGQMLDMWRAYYDALMRSTHPHSDGLRSWAQLRLREYVDLYAEGRLTDAEAPLKRRLIAAKALERALLAYAEIMKDALERDPADVGTISGLNTDLNGLLQHWYPEHDQPSDWVVEHWAESGQVAGPELARLREQARRNAELAAAKDRLVRLRRMHRLGLAFWALRRLRDTEDAAWARGFEGISGYLANPQEATTALGDALRYEWENNGPWSKWILHELPTHEAHFVSPDGGLFDAYAVTLIRVTAADAAAPDLPFDERVAMEVRVESAEARLERILNDDRLASILPEGAALRSAVVQEALDALLARAEVAEDEAVVAASLDADLVEEFRDAAVAKWREKRVLRAMFVRHGTVVGMPDPPPSEKAIALTAWVSKRLFLRERQVIGHTWEAEHAAHSLTQREHTRVLESLIASSEPALNSGDVAADVRAAIAGLRNDGYTDLVVLMPSSWELGGRLGVATTDETGRITAPAWLPSEDRHDFRGVIEGVPVIQLNELESRVLVVDSSRVGRWREWGIGGNPTINVTGFDADAAREAVVGRVPEAEVAERVAAVLRSARIDLDFAVDVVVDDEDAVRAVAVQADDEGTA